MLNLGLAHGKGVARLWGASLFIMLIVACSRPQGKPLARASAGEGCSRWEKGLSAG